MTKTKLQVMREKKSEGNKMNDKRIAEIVAEELIKQDAKRYRAMKKLSIPKKIAEELDKLEFDWDMMVFQNISEGDYQELFDFIDRGNSPIIMTYLAGKALGVDLVKVVADD